MEKVAFFENKDLPNQIIDSAHIVRSSEAKLQMIMDAPRVESYEKPDHRTVYPQGFVLHFYDEARHPRMMIRAKYGIQIDDKQLMEARDNVVIIDYQTGDTSYLDHLVWDQMSERIYSNSPIRSVNGLRVTLGDGFESDDQFLNPQILHQRGTVLIEEE